MFAGVQKLNSKNAEEIVTLKAQIEDLDRDKKRLEERNTAVQRDLDRKTRQIAEAQGEVGRMEVKEVRALYADMENSLKCSQNPHLWKDTVIAKCGHLFARQSLEENLAKRNRKCPICGVKYDRADMMSVQLYSP